MVQWVGSWGASQLGEGTSSTNRNHSSWVVLYYLTRSLPLTELLTGLPMVKYIVQVEDICGKTENLKPEYMEKKGFVEAHAGDGLVEIFCLKQEWHAFFVVLVNIISAKHLAQRVNLRRHQFSLNLEVENGKKVSCRWIGSHGNNR